MNQAIIQTVKAVGLKAYLPIQDPASLIDLELPLPQAEGQDLLVKVEAISVNPVDTKVRNPKDKIEENHRILGWDAAGSIIAVGKDVTGFKVGDAVYYAGDITRPGSNSQYQLVDARIVGRKPTSLSFAEAAALPLTGITASEGLFDRLKITAEGSAGKTLLIIGGAGGVGSMAIQLAKQVPGLKIIATASRPESAEWCRTLGTDEVINHNEDLTTGLRAKGFQFVDYIFCLNTTAHYWPTMCELIAPQGAICSIVEPEAPIDLGLLKAKSASFAWESMFTRSTYKTADMIEQQHILNRIADLIDAKKIRSSVNKILSPINAKNLRAAHAEIEAKRTIGKIVLEKWE